MPKGKVNLLIVLLLLVAEIAFPKARPRQPNPTGSTNKPRSAGPKPRSTNTCRKLEDSASMRKPMPAAAPNL